MPAEFPPWKFVEQLQIILLRFTEIFEYMQKSFMNILCVLYEILKNFIR